MGLIANGRWNANGTSKTTNIRNPLAQHMDHRQCPVTNPHPLDLSNWVVGVRPAPMNEWNEPAWLYRGLQANHGFPQLGWGTLRY